jgi:hypothetical protein
MFSQIIVLAFFNKREGCSEQSWTGGTWFNYSKRETMMKDRLCLTEIGIVFDLIDASPFEEFGKLKFLANGFFNDGDDPTHPAMPKICVLVLRKTVNRSFVLQNHARCVLLIQHNLN